MKRRGSQVGLLDQLELKTDVLHYDRDGETYMTQPVGFIAANLLSVDD